MFNSTQRERAPEIRINRRIRVPEVRVINAEGEQLGIMATAAALKLAEEAILDLVEVSPKAMPPVCRIMDYGKYKYLQKKKAQETRQPSKEPKEVKIRYMTDPHDIETRTNHVREFLAAGFDVKLTLSFRGREIVHKALGVAKLTAMAQAVADLGQPRSAPSSLGKTVQLWLAPKG